MSPTQRSLKLMRERGFTVTIVERYNSFIKQRFDAFGFGDVLCCRVTPPEIVLVQTTTAKNMSARRDKIKASAEAGIWLAAGGRIILHGWRKSKGRWGVIEEVL